jgi:AmmeMemoRadiSam system protein A
MMEQTLSQHQRDALLQLARSAVARAIGLQAERGPCPERGSTSRVEGAPPAMAVRAGAFVSLHLGHDLRGCIGYLEADLPLVEVVERCAASAAVSDPRFPPLGAAEWPRVTIEISVLGPLEPVADISEIEIGRHGLVAALGVRRGLLLPQVAAEWKWTAEEFIRHTCRKAGLPADAWQKGATLHKFEADVFSEKT